MMDDGFDNLFGSKKMDLHDSPKQITGTIPEYPPIAT